MNMRYLIGLIFTIVSISVFGQGGSNCSAAVSSPVSLPFSATNQTTCGMGNVYTSGNSTVCGNGVYLDGEDIVYAFTPTTSGLININVTSSATWVGLFLYQGCPSGGTCLDNATSSSGNQTLSNVNVTAGVTYYVVVDKWLSPTCITSFNINISAPTPAPTPTVQDCLGAIAVCQNVYSEANAYSGTGNILNEINSGISCLGSGEKNDVWYTFTTQTAGNVCFTIDPNVNSDDYDWAVYNLTNNPCSDIATNSGIEVSCNYSGTSGNTGPNGQSGSQNEPCIPVQAGETYVVNVSQFSVSTNGYTIDFGASTATIFDNVPPELQSLNSTIICGMSTMSFNFTENITCSTLSDNNLTLSGPGGPYTLSSVSGANCATGATQDKYFTISISPAITEPGTYSFCLDNSDNTVTDLCGNLAVDGCINFDVIYPTADAVVNDTLTCSSPLITLDGSGSSLGTYNWVSIGGNIVSGQTSTMPQVNQTGYYFIEVNSNDCISRDTVEVFQDSSLPIVTAGQDTSLTCVVDTVQLNGSVTGGPDVVYYWSGPGIVSGDSTLNPIVYVSGTYVLTATDTVTGCELSSSINVVEDMNLPFVDAGSDVNIDCVNSSVQLNGTGSVAGSEYIYQWFDAVGNMVDDSVITSVSIPGTYTLQIFNSNNNCSAEDDIMVGVDTIRPIASAGADTSLNCATILTGVPLDGSGSFPGADYLWTTADGNIVSGTNSNVALVNASGTYTITVTNPSNGCQNTDDVLVVVDTIKPTAHAGIDMQIDCNNPSVILDGTQSSTGTNIIYAWTGGVVTNGGTTTTPTVASGATYTLTVTNTSNECTATDQAFVSSDFNVPGANAGGGSLICTGDQFTLSGSTNSGNVYYWTTTDGNIVSGDSTLTPVIDAGGTYTLTAINTANGCQSTSNVVVTEETATAVIVANPLSGPSPLTVDFMNSGVADSSYWDFGNGNVLGDTSSLSTASVIYDDQGNYIVTLTSFNGVCQATTQVTVQVFGISSLIVPNVFTPNKDGENDYFEFIYQYITELNCVIFNRWGRKVAELNSPDAKWNGDGASAGTYYYVLTAKGEDDVDYELKGTITLLK